MIDIVRSSHRAEGGGGVLDLAIEVTMDVTVVAPRGRAGAMGGFSKSGLPTVTEAFAGFSTGVRPVGVFMVFPISLQAPYHASDRHQFHLS